MKNFNELSEQITFYIEQSNFVVHSEQMGQGWILLKVDYPGESISPARVSINYEGNVGKVSMWLMGQSVSERSDLDTMDPDMLIGRIGLSNLSSDKSSALTTSFEAMSLMLYDKRNELMESIDVAATPVPDVPTRNFHEAVSWMVVNQMMACKENISEYDAADAKSEATDFVTVIAEFEKIVASGEDTQNYIADALGHMHSMLPSIEEYANSTGSSPKI